MKFLHIIFVGIFLVACGGNSESEIADLKAQLELLEDALETEAEEKRDGSRYYNNDLHISVKNNDDWEIKENYEDIPVFFMSPLDDEEDLFRENINMVSEYAPGYSLTKYYEANLEGVNKYLTGFEIIEDGVDVKINGHDFKKMLYKHNSDGYDFKVLVYFAVKGGKGYVINCTGLSNTFDDFKEDFEALANSFKFE